MNWQALSVGSLRDVAPCTLQAYWPEANVLIGRRLDPKSKEPDYNVRVSVEKCAYSEE
jgi:hypothetical protein